MAARTFTYVDETRKAPMHQPIVAIIAGTEFLRDTREEGSILTAVVTDKTQADRLAKIDGVTETTEKEEPKAPAAPATPPTP